MLSYYTFKAPEVERLKKDLESLNDVYRDLADEIGIENTLTIYRLFHGTQVSFPNRLFSTDYIQNAVLIYYNGVNVRKLEHKF